MPPYYRVSQGVKEWTHLVAYSVFRVPESGNMSVWRGWADDSLTCAPSLLAGYGGDDDADVSGDDADDATAVFWEVACSYSTLWLERRFLTFALKHEVHLAAALPACSIV